MRKGGQLIPTCPRENLVKTIPITIPLKRRPTKACRDIKTNASSQSVNKGSKGKCQAEKKE